jgi:hypothetical protein
MIAWVSLSGPANVGRQIRAERWKNFLSPLASVYNGRLVFCQIAAVTENKYENK